MQANSEYNDAFYAVKEYKGGTSTSENITLTRPFAQVNFGTDDAEKQLVKEAYPDGVYTTVTINLHTKMNLLNGKVLDKQEYTTKLATTASMSAESFPAVHQQEGKKYDYVNMLYAMVPKEGFTYDITLKAYNGATEGAKPIETINVPSAPLKQNWRTNIFGSLYTSDTNFNVIIDNHFIDQNNLDLNNEITVNTFPELQAAVKKANATPNTTILVNSDITIPSDSTITFTGTNTTFDIAEGKTLTLTSTPQAPYSYFPLKITKEATVTFCGQGKITGDVHMLENYGNLTINSGHYVITGNTIIDHLGKLTINGGYFNGRVVIFQWKDLNGYTIINGGEFRTSDECFDYIGTSDARNFTIKNGLFKSNYYIACLPSINISGGTFIRNYSDPMEGTIERTSSDTHMYLFHIYNYKATISGGDFYVSKNTQMNTFKFEDKVEVQITGGRYSSIEGFSPSTGFEWKQINEPALPNTSPLLYQIVPSAK